MDGWLVSIHILGLFCLQTLCPVFSLVHARIEGLVKEEFARTSDTSHGHTVPAGNVLTGLRGVSDVHASFRSHGRANVGAFEGGGWLPRLCCVTWS